MTETARRPSSPGAVADRILAGVVFVVSVAAFVALELLERETTGLLVLVGPVVAALLVNGKIDNVKKETERQSATLTRVERQTNGVLDERIRSGTLRALQDAGIVSAPAGAELPLEPVRPPAPASAPTLGS